MKNLFLLFAVFFLFNTELYPQDNLPDEMAQAINAVEQEVIQWRRHFHENPELSNREFKTAEYVAKFLTDLGLEVKTGLAHTAVIGYLKGGQDGPTIGLRADMDGLPVTERVDVPFASKVTTNFMGKETGVMHACGHDAHMAMLMGAAKVLTAHKDKLKGNVVFVFQPAEEGAPTGEKGGASYLIEEGLFDLYPIEVFFGQHIWAGVDVGTINYKPGGFMAASNSYELHIRGVQSHGSEPWSGIDPITVAAQTVLGFQNIVSRMSELTKEPVVISVGQIEAGNRNNIIPEEARLIGTIRTLDEDMKRKVFADMEKMATNIAEAYGATAKLVINDGNPVTYNDPELTAKMIPSLKRAGNAVESLPITGAEDYSFYGQHVPALFVFVGGRPLNDTREQVAAHHTPDFYIDESGFITGVRSLVHLTWDYMQMK